MYRFLIVTCLVTLAGLVGVLTVSSLEPAADVVLINGAEVHNLDPARMTWSHDIRTAYGLWEGLLTLDPKDGVTLLPGVAERFTLSPDGRTYTFFLRHNARWSNGDPVTAADFRFAWLRVLDPATASDYYRYMTLIEGAGEYYEAMVEASKKDSAKRQATAAVQGGKIPDANSVRIDVVDDYTLRVRLVHPTSYFPELAAFSTFLPVHRRSMEKFRLPVENPGEPTRYSSEWLQPGNLVTNGPFVLTRWDFQYRLVLTRNEQYWDRANVPSGRIELLANPDPQTAFLAYESGAADVITNLPEMVAPALLAKHARGERPDLNVFPVWGTYYYRFNCKAGPMADPRVRRALAMCVDREAIVRTITRRGERPQTSFVTPGLSVSAPASQPGEVSAKRQADGISGMGWRIAGDRIELVPADSPAARSPLPNPPPMGEGTMVGPGWRIAGERIEYVPAEGLPFDPAAARKLLAAAGFGEGGKPFVMPDGARVTLLVSESSAHKDIGEAVIKMWRDNLGIDVELNVQISNIFGQRMQSHKFDIARSNWYTDYADPTGFLEMFRSSDGNNDGQFQEPEYDRLLEEASRTADGRRRFELIHRAEKILVADQAGVIPMYQMVGQFMVRPAVRGIWPNAKQQIMLKYVGVNHQEHQGHQEDKIQ